MQQHLCSWKVAIPNRAHKHSVLHHIVGRLADFGALMEGPRYAVNARAMDEHTNNVVAQSKGTVQKQVGVCAFMF